MRLPDLIGKARVQRPGSRGGHGYFTASGAWVYGPPPADSGDLVGRHLYLVDARAAFRVLRVDGDQAVCELRDMNGRTDRQTLPVPMLREGIGSGKVVLMPDQVGPAHEGPLAFVRRLTAKAARGTLLLVKGAKEAKAATPATDAPEPDGRALLGKTKGGKPVYASGAETDGYSDDDHAHAGMLHARALGHHDGKGTAHREAADGEDTDWMRGEGHHREHERHAKLADHHAELARLHLTAAGKADHVDLDLSGDTPTLGTPRPADATERATAKKTLAGRTHHNHPGELSPSDRDAYATLASDENADARG